MKPFKDNPKKPDPKEGAKRKIAVRLVPLNHSPTLPVFGARLFSYRVLGSVTPRHALYTLMSTLRVPLAVEAEERSSDGGSTDFTLTDWTVGSTPWTARVQAGVFGDHLISLWQGRAP